MAKERKPKLICPECGSEKILVKGKIVDVIFFANYPEPLGEGEYGVVKTNNGTPFIHNDSSAECYDCNHKAQLFFFRENV